MCDISEIEPRNLPHPTSTLSKQVISSCVPDLSLLVPDRKSQAVNQYERNAQWKPSSHINVDIPRREIQIPYNDYNTQTVSNNNNWESVKISTPTASAAATVPSNLPTSLDKCDFSQDLRFKFYQQLQLNSVLNQKEINSMNHLDLKNNQLELSIPNLGDLESKTMLNHNYNVNEPQLINSTRSEGFNGINNMNNHCQCNENIKQLLFLIQQQNNEIHLLKTQVDSLILNINQINNNNNNRSKSPKVHYETKSTQSSFNLDINKNESKKTSVGVMTSFEFPIENNSPSNRDAQEIFLLKESNSNHKDEKLKSIEVINSPKSKLEKIIERPEMKMDKFDKKKKYDDDVKVQRLNHQSNERIASPGNYSNDSGDTDVLKTSKTWTFYNNVLSQVNELLQGSHDIRTSKVIYDKMQASTKQLKFFESTYTSLTDAVATDNIDQINIETSYYPRVNYQTNAIQPSNSINDSNTSIHMKALALKYLGAKNCIDSEQSDKCWPINNRHILDISHLKRQPKLL